MRATQRPAAPRHARSALGPARVARDPELVPRASSDRVIPPGAERVMAERATTIEIESSHVAMISHPDVVTSLVRDAVAAIAG